MSDMNSHLGTEYISSSDAAALYGITNDHVARLCRQKKIAGTLQDGFWLVDKPSLANFFEGRRVPRNLKYVSHKDDLRFGYYIEHPNVSPIISTPKEQPDVLPTKRVFAFRSGALGVLVLMLILGNGIMFSYSAPRFDGSSQTAGVAQAFSFGLSDVIFGIKKMFGFGTTPPFCLCSSCRNTNSKSCTNRGGTCTDQINKHHHGTRGGKTNDHTSARDRAF